LDLARLRLEINRLTAAVGFVDEAIMVVAKARGFTLRLDPAPDKGSGASLASGVFGPRRHRAHGAGSLHGR
jgi:hypothetical protein